MSADYNKYSVDATLARVEAKLDRALKEIEEHGKRISAVERLAWMALGIAAVLPVAIQIWGALRK